MKQAPIPGPAWIPDFLHTLAATRIVKAATEAAGVGHGAIYFQRNRNRLFADAWDNILAGAPPPPRPRKGLAKADAPKRALNAGWIKVFLEHLAQTSNISASAELANAPIASVYRERRKNQSFAAQWRAALFEGYASLEMELLGHLRGPAPGRSMDVANALRLLAAHKDAIAAERAVRANVSAAEVRASIDRKVEAWRQQIAAQRSDAGE